MRLWILATFYAVLLLTLSGCVAKPTPKKEVTIDNTLQVVKLTSNGTALDSNVVAFEWDAITDTRVKGIYIYKMSMEDNLSEAEFYHTIQTRFITHFVDSNIIPDTKYSYYFKTFSDEAESRKSKVKIINSLPVLQSVSWIHSIQGMPRSAKIIWRPHTNKKVKAYIIERRILKEDNWEEIAIVNNRFSAEFIDIELKDKYVYKYRVRVLTYDNITSSPSQIVKVVTKALPKEINNIKATVSLPKEIKIKWDKSLTKDFKSYNLYRSQYNDGGYEVIAKLQNNSFSDICEEDGKEYFYKVSVVDKDDLESKYDRNSVRGMTLRKPEAPAVVEAKLVNNKVKIFWSKTDSRTVSYIVSKRYKKGWFEELSEDFEGIKGKKFIDSDIQPSIIYYYKVFAIDSNGIKSEPSIEVEFKSPAAEVKETTKAKENTEAKVSKNEEQSVVVVDEKELSNTTVIPNNDFN